MEKASNYPHPPFPPQNISPPGVEKKMDPKPKFIGENYSGSGKLAGKTAIITGGDSGIGRSVAVHFAREGANVALVYLPEEQVDAETTARYIKKEKSNSILLPGDVSDPQFCRAAIEQCVETFGAVDILVNNAAFQNHCKELLEISDEQWDHTFKVNIYGYFNMVKATLPIMKEGSVIINTGSITGLEGNKELIDYAATKGAIHAFTKSLAQNLVPKRIRVNCVAPGPVWTPLNPAERSDGEMKEFGADTPMGRPAQPEEIAPAFVFFASNVDSGYVTGEVLTLLGGDTTAA